MICLIVALMTSSVTKLRNTVTILWEGDLKQMLINFKFRQFYAYDCVNCWIETYMPRLCKKHSELRIRVFFLKKLIFTYLKNNTYDHIVWVFAYKAENELKWIKEENWSRFNSALQLLLLAMLSTIKCHFNEAEAYLS